MHRGAIAEVDLSAIAHNLSYTKKIVQNRPVIAVVKADAYGHGALQISKKLIKEGITCLAVAFICEAQELRDSGIKAPIIVLFAHENPKAFFDLKLIPVIHDMNFAISLSKEASKLGKRIGVHIKVDTGMGRMGLTGNNIIDAIMKISKLPGIDLQGILSHFSEADLSDRSYALFQLKRFNSIKTSVSEQLKRKIFSHFANSAAVLALPEAYLDAVRPGIMLYGYSPISRKDQKKKAESKQKQKLLPVMCVKTKILSVRTVPSGTPISYGRTFITKRESRIGVLSIGYADGYSRLFSNNAEVLVKGKRAPVIGRVCMDLTMIDVTDIQNLKNNDEVVLLGKQGNDMISADELALRADTISYEILTTLGGKSKKTYVKSY